MSDEKKTGIPWSKIIIGIIIYVLFMLWTNQRNENERAQQEFAMQTARAENQKAASISATQEIEDKIKDCIRINETPRNVGTYQCVIGFIADVEEAAKVDSSEPTFYVAYFDLMPNTFYIVGEKLYSYTGDCVKVWGESQVNQDGTPAMSIYEDRNGINIERLQDDVCRR